MNKSEFIDNVAEKAQMSRPDCDQGNAQLREALAAETRVLRKVRDIGVIPVSVTTDDGMTGLGFSWTPSIGATAVRALIDDDLAPFLRGRDHSRV